MRSVQRIRHQRPPGSWKEPDFQRGERRAIRDKKRGIWSRRLARLSLIGLAAAFGAALCVLLVDRRVLLDAIVRADLVVVRAPAGVRVHSIHVRAGQSFERGDALLSLEPRDMSALLAERLEVETARKRLQIAERGGDTGLFDLGRRSDLVARAALERASAAAALEVAKQRLEAALLEERTLELAREAELTLTAGEIARLEAELETARVTVAERLNAARLTEVDARSKAELRAEGVVSVVEEVAAEVARDGSRLDVELALSSQLSLQRALESAKEEERARRHLHEAEMQRRKATTETARREVTFAGIQREYWQRILEERDGYLPKEGVDGDELRRIELDLLRAQLKAREARFASLEKELGATVVYAECDGVVDRIEILSGAIVDAGEPLLQYYDPTTIRVLAFGEPVAAGTVAVGDACRISVPGRSSTIGGVVGAVGASLSRPPVHLLAGTGTEADYLLPLEVDVGPERASQLRPNQRVKVILRPDARARR